MLSIETQVTSETQIIRVMASIGIQDFYCLVRETGRGSPFEFFCSKEWSIKGGHAFGVVLIDWIYRNSVNTEYFDFPRH